MSLQNDGAADVQSPGSAASAAIPITYISQCQSKMETRVFVNRWTIEQFSVQQELCPTGDSLESAPFGSSDGEYKFTLKLFPSGKDEECSGFLSLFLQINKCPQPRLQFRVNFSIETLEGSKGCALNKNVVTINKGGIVTASKFFSAEMLKQRSARLIPNDELTICVNLTVYGEMKSVQHAREMSMDEEWDEMVAAQPACASSAVLCSPGTPPTARRQVGHDALSLATSSRNASTVNLNLVDNETSLECLFSSGELSDFVIDCGGRELRVHKCILAARSKYFAAMFSNAKSQEMREGKLFLPDVNVDELECVLRWLYSLHAPAMDDDNWAHAIMKLADRMCCEGLRDRCEVSLLRGVNVANVSDRLRIADSMSAARLHRRCVAFVATHRDAVFESEGWADVCACDPVLAARVTTEAWKAADTPRASFALLPKRPRTLNNRLE